MNKGVEIAMSFEQPGGEPYGGAPGESVALLQANEQLAIPQVHSPLEGGPEAPPQGQQTPTPQQQPQGAPQQQAQSQGQQQSQSVPYERFQQQNENLRQAQSQLQAQQAAMAALQNTLAQHGLLPGAPQQGGDPRKAAEEFYRNPQGYVDRANEQQREFVAQQFQQLQNASQYGADKMAFRQAHGVNSPVEQAVVGAIQRYGLQAVPGLPPSAALRIAYHLATGQDFDSAVLGPGAQKARLSPPAGSGAGAQPQGMTPADLAKMPMAEFAKDPQGIAARLMQSVTAQPM